MLEDVRAQANTLYAYTTKPRDRMCRWMKYRKASIDEFSLTRFFFPVLQTSAQLPSLSLPLSVNGYREFSLSLPTNRFAEFFSWLVFFYFHYHRLIVL